MFVGFSCICCQRLGVCEIKWQLASVAESLLPRVQTKEFVSMTNRPL